jgi:hypothetical protein
VRPPVAVLLAAPLLVAAPALAGPLYADATVAEYFRVEWRATPGTRGAVIDGQVQNLSNLPFDRVQLLVERLDAAGAVTGTSRVWALGLLPAHQRTYFSTQVPPAASYRITIASFDWANCRD